MDLHCATRWRRRTPLVAVLAVVGVLVGVTPAGADYFGGRYADSSIHTYCSSETTSSDYNELQPKVKASMDHLAAVTDMYASATSCTSTTDFYWYATDQSNFTSSTVLGGTTCVNTLSDNKCDRFRIRFNEDQLDRTNTQIRHTACHEISHSLGSDDGLTVSTGCFPQSSYSDGISHTTHEIYHINAQY